MIPAPHRSADVDLTEEVINDKAVSIESSDAERQLISNINNDLNMVMTNAGKNRDNLKEEIKGWKVKFRTWCLPVPSLVMASIPAPQF